jgi:hypothetical protein
LCFYILQQFALLSSHVGAVVVGLELLLAVIIVSFRRLSCGIRRANLRQWIRHCCIMGTFAYSLTAQAPAPKDQKE